MSSSNPAAAIVGVAESDLGIVPDRTVLGMHAQAARRALDDAGIEPHEVDGVMAAGPFAYMQSITVAEYLDIHPILTDSTNIGGSAYEAHVGHAAAAISAGHAEVILLTYGSTQRSERMRPGSTSPRSMFESPFGHQYPMAAYALAAQRHMAIYGTTPRDLAEIAVAARKWAQRNPMAYRHEDLTIDDVMASPVVMSPLRKLDSCLVVDGGGAVVITTAERARSMKKKPVWILGQAEAHTHNHILSMPDLTVTPAAMSGPEAMKRAGVTHDDIDVVQTYDSFTITTLLALEDMGFCEKGEGGAFVADGRIAPGGDFPLNTSGGGLSYCHPGLFGIFLLIEGVRQLRGECEDRQVPDAQIALCNGVGGVLSSTATVVLGAD